MSVLDQQYTMITKFPLAEDAQVARNDGNRRVLMDFAVPVCTTLRDILYNM